MRSCRWRDVWIALLAIAADRLTKLPIRQLPIGQGRELLPGVLRLTHLENSGVAFSMLSASPALPMLLAAIPVLGITAWLLWGAGEKRTLLRTGLWLVVGGGIGNLIDRCLYGTVTDFLEPVFVRFAVFNVADIAVCVGVGLAVPAILIEERAGKAHREDGD